jgi:hypothetical protein
LEEALLHGGIVNIETKRMELEGINLSRNEIRKMLTKQYRVFSRKQAFTCPCCDELVKMNLTVDDGRPFYFKHLDGKECTYSENSKTYDRQVSTHQDKKKLEKQRVEAEVRNRRYHEMMRRFEEQVEFEMLQRAKAAF